MLKTITLVSFAVILVACSAGEDSPARHTADDRDAATDKGTVGSVTSTTITTDGSCPASGSTTPQKTPSPFERCEGVYDCPEMGTDYWFSFDGENCTFGPNDYGTVTFYADGRLKNEDGQIGHWTGSYVAFSSDIPWSSGDFDRGHTAFGCARKGEQK